MRNRDKIILTVILSAIAGNISVIVLKKIELLAVVSVFELISVALMTLCMILDIYCDKASRWFDKRNLF